MTTYNPEQLGIKPPAGGFQEGGWYGGRQYIGGTLSEPGQIHPSSSQVGAGQAVSPEVVAAGAATQGVTPEQQQAYLQQQRQAGAGVAPTTPTTPTEAAGAIPGAGLGITTPGTINLPEMYKSFYESAGISKLEADYSQKEKEFIEAKAKVNDNPFLSEATRVGRIAKLEQLFAERTANLQRDIAVKKADVEMQLNLQTQQFNIESTVAQNALARLNTLLGMGALDNATGETIASLTRSTGVSSDLIYSAIKSSKAKQTSVTTWSDGTNDYFVTVDQYGNITNKQLIGPSAKVAGTVTERQIAMTESAATVDVQAGITAEEFARKYGGTLDDWKLINIYNQSSIYGPMAESAKTFHEWATGKAVGLDEEAITAYVNAIISGTITLTNVPQAYRSEVTKRLEQYSQSSGSSPNVLQRIKQILGGS